MKFYKCVNEVKPSYVVDTEPQFSETVLYQNQGTAVENEITLSNDYHNYDIIKITCCDPNLSDTTSSFYATPGILDFLITDNNPYVNCNMLDTNHYIVYQINSGTSLTYKGGRYIYITQIIGLKCTNGTIVETEIFSRERADSWVPINTELNLFEFNLILTLTSTRAWDESTLNNIVFMKPTGNNTYYGSTEINNQLNVWRVIHYTSDSWVGLTNHYISDCRWYYVTGLKFIPNWDYYIEDIDSSYPSPINTQLKLASEENANKNWEISFKCSRIDQASALIDFGTTSNSSGTLFGGALDTWGYSGNGFRWVGSRSAANFSVTTLNKEFYISKKNNILQIYVDNQLIKEVTFGSYTSYSENPLVLGRIDWKGADLYNIVHWDYFGFRWLS